MALEHRGWTASRNRALNHFEVLGTVTPPELRLGDGGVMVTTKVMLEKPDHQPLLPAILILRLYVEQERHYPYASPAQPLSYPARYYRTPIGPDEDACTTVRIRHNGDTLRDIAVRDE